MPVDPIPVELADEVAEEILRERDRRELHGRLDAMERRMASIQRLLTELALRSPPSSDRRAAIRNQASDQAVVHALGLTLHQPVAGEECRQPCDQAYPACRSACCRLIDVPLAKEELDLHPWDIARPFYMARRQDGACARLGDDGRCAVYASRPAFCRTYTCMEDLRVWQAIDQSAI